MTLLAGDLGGTKTLLALCQNDGTLLYSQRLSSQAFPSLDEMVAAFLAAPEGQGWDRPSKAAFGVAGPVTEIPASGSAAEPSHQRAHITNLHYHIDTQTLAQRAGLSRVRLCNDFYAVALAIAQAATPGANTAIFDLVALNPSAQASPHGTVAVLGAGTGMGQALIARSVQPAVILPTEGGHSDFAARDEVELALLRFLLKRHPDHVSVERVLCGAGLVMLYEFFCSHEPAQENPAVTAAIAAAGGSGAAVISQQALADTDALCSLALQRFVMLYGAEASNLALKSLATGGVYLAGGIAAKILPKMTDGVFMQNFVRKGRFSALCQQLPVYIVKNPDIGLFGAAFLASTL